MKKITLMDIMESLNSDDMDAANLAIHEWFVDHGKQIQANISGEQVVEAGIPVESEEELNSIPGYPNIVPEVEIGKDGVAVTYEVTARNGATVAIYIDSYGIGFNYDAMVENLQEKFEEENASISNEEASEYMNEISNHLQDCIEYSYSLSKPMDDEDVDEARVDELSVDTMKSYAKKARKSRDSHASSDEQIMRRYQGLDMVAAKARREKAALQYEGEQLGEVSSDLNQVHGYENIVPEVNISGDYASMVYEVTSQSGITVAIDMDTSIPFYKISEVAKNSLAEAFDRAGAEISDQECSLYAEAIVNHVGQVIEYLDTVEESADALIAELHEAFKGLETISDKLQNVEGAQVGEEGKVSVNTKATLPSHKGKDRLGGDPVEVKGKGHTGHALEKAPKVADVKVKNTVQNGKEELKKVADKGNTSALLNKKDGKENTQSPISGKGAKGLKK